MATTPTLIITLPMGPKKVQLWSYTIGGSDTAATWDTGLDNVDVCLPNTNSDQAFGGVFHNFSDTGTTVAAGVVYIDGLANSSTGKVFIIGN